MTIRGYLYFSLLATVFAFVGCSPTPSEHKVSAQTHSVSGFALSKDTTNGGIASITKISECKTGMALYHMFYWSQNQKVEAYVVEPIQKGKYPLLVNCHGGFIVDTPSESAYTPFTYSAHNILTNIPPDAVYIYPNYRGYGASEGYVHGMTGVVQDIENVIIASKSMSEVKPNDLYLLGTSLGGGAALIVADKLPDTKAVVAISPFVGADIFVDWYNKLGKPLDWLSAFEDYTNAYGSNTHGSLYIANSPYDNTSNIHAPVLLLQGTSDDEVMWQTVQAYADQLKHENKVVKLELVRGGDHGLSNDLQSTYSEVDAWLEQYGMQNVY